MSNSTFDSDPPFKHICCAKTNKIRKYPQHTYGWAWAWQKSAPVWILMKYCAF